MQIKTFILPVLSAESSEEALNKFLRSHRVLQLERHFCSENSGYWAILVEYVDGDLTDSVPPAHRRDRQNAAQDLNDDEKQRYEVYRQVRSTLATKNAVPAYLIFTNEELATLAKLPELNETTIKEVKSIAPSRLKAYIEHFYTATNAEESRKPDVPDSGAGEPA